MLLTCHHCNHAWETDLEDEVAEVWCNRCGQKTPFKLATQPPRSPSAHDPSDAPTMAPSSPPPTYSRPTPTPADHVSMPTINVGPLSAHDDSEAPTMAPTSRMPGEAPTIPGTTPPPGSTARPGTAPPRTAAPRSTPPPRVTPGGSTAPQQRRPPTGAPSSAPASSPAPSAAKPRGLRVETEALPTDAMVGRQVDGYRIEGKLGEGGMGAVYRAHQLSLDRDVALKVLPARYARSPDMVARFTREALSAAQLTHHNIIQVYDVGNERGLNFITMELVEGESMSDAMRRDGRFQVDDAAGYMLQAARGLQYAHERGIIHRDIKPANLMINRQGIVKIADMGLAKRIADRDIAAAPTMREGGSAVADSRLVGGAAAELTQASVAMGTPAYMAPEQGEDAGSVDGRADQYSLGCTLYYLCTGHTPFDGNTAQEIISKHKSEPLPPLSQYVQNVPAVFDGLIRKMLAKSPDQRYPSLKEVIHELELFLGIDSEKGPYTPREQHLAILEQQCAAYYAAPSLGKRRLAVRGFLMALPLLLAVGLIFAWQGDGIGFAGGIFGLGVMTAIANFIFEGAKTKGFLFRRLRSVILGITAKGWAVTGAGLLVGVTLFWLLGWLFYWIVFAVIGTGLAFAYQRIVANALRTERAPAIDTTKEMLKELRLKGVPEEGMQNFVCRFTGADWEEFFEELFGYEAMIEARARWAGADPTHHRRKYATWREPLVRWIEKVENARRQAKENKELARVEKERLKAEGMAEAEAEQQSKEAAREFQQEQLHKIAAKDVDWSKFQSQGAARKKVSLNFLPWFIRATIALGIAYASFLPSPWAEALPAPDFVREFLNNHYYALGLGDTPWAFAGAMFALLAAFSRRPIAPWLSLLGAIMIVSRNQVVDLVHQPQFNDVTAFLTAAGLAAGGFLICVLGKLTGDKY